MQVFVLERDRWMIRARRLDGYNQHNCSQKNRPSMIAEHKISRFIHTRIRKVNPLLPLNCSSNIRIWCCWNCRLHVISLIDAYRYKQNLKTATFVMIVPWRYRTNRNDIITEKQHIFGFASNTRLPMNTSVHSHSCVTSNNNKRFKFIHSSSTSRPVL